jgi:hypothetical protein
MRRAFDQSSLEGSVGHGNLDYLHFIDTTLRCG